MRGKNARTLEHRLQYPECETEAQMIHGTHTLNHTLDRITWPICCTTMLKLRSQTP